MPDLDLDLDTTSSKPDYSDVSDNLSDLMDSIKSGPKSAPPSREKIDSLMEAIQKNQLKLNPQADLSQVQELQSRAYDMYDRRASRDEWLQFANTIGQALSRIGMGAAGMKHRVDVSGIQLPQSPNFLADESRGETELTKQLGFANQMREHALQQNRYSNMQAEQEWRARNKPLAEQLGAEKDIYNQGMGAYKAEQMQHARDLRQLQAEKTRAELAAAKPGPVDKSAIQAEKQVKSADNLYDILSSHADNSGHVDYSDISRDRAAAQVAKSAGVDLETAANKFSQASDSATTNKHFFGKNDVDESKRAETFKSGILGKSPAAPAPASASADQASQMVTVLDPQSGQAREIPREHLDAALQAGYKLAPGNK